jgi:hypothetical protein
MTYWPLTSLQWAAHSSLGTFSIPQIAGGDDESVSADVSFVTRKLQRGIILTEGRRAARSASRPAHLPQRGAFGGANGISRQVWEHREGSAQPSRLSSLGLMGDAQARPGLGRRLERLVRPRHYPINHRKSPS